MLAESGHSDNQRAMEPNEQHDCSRRDALKAIARFSAYVAPATYVLLDSKSAFALTCSGAAAELLELELQNGGTRRERRRRRRRKRRLRRFIRRNC